MLVFLDSAPGFDETASHMRYLKRSVFILCLFLAASTAHLADIKNSAVDFLKRADLSGVRGGNLVAAVASDPSNFNRMLTWGLPQITITERLSADLVHINRNTFQLEPSLATRWESDKADQNYTIHLRRGIRFSDNSPFTADDVIFTFQVLTDPKILPKMAGQIEVDGSFPTISKIDEYTVRLSFPRPVGMGLRMLDSIPILPKKRLFQAYQEGRFETVWGTGVTPEEVVGLGPFRLKEYKPGEKVVLERNPHYWKTDQLGQTLPYLDSITFLIIRDSDAEALRFEQGEFDLTNALNPGNYASLRRSANEKGYVLQDLGPGLVMDFLWFNLNRGNRAIDPEKLLLFEKPEFRRSISYAIDRQGMARSILLGLGEPEYGPVSSGNQIWYHTGMSRTEYNPQRSRELLSQIGLRDVNSDGILEYGSKKQPLDISLFTSRGNSAREKAAQVIQDNLSKIGIRVGIQLFLPQEIAARVSDSFNYEAILFGFTPTDVAPDLQIDLWYSSGRNHFWNPNQKKPERPWEAEMDALIFKMTRSSDPEIRISSFRQFQDIWARELPAIPMYAPKILAGWSKKLGNIRPSILAPHLLWNAEEITKRNPL